MLDSMSTSPSICASSAVNAWLKRANSFKSAPCRLTCTVLPPGPPPPSPITERISTPAIRPTRSRRMGINSCWLRVRSRRGLSSTVMVALCLPCALPLLIVV